MRIVLTPKEAFDILKDNLLKEGVDFELFEDEFFEICIEGYYNLYADDYESDSVVRADVSFSNFRSYNSNSVSVRGNILDEESSED